MLRCSLSCAARRQPLHTALSLPASSLSVRSFSALAGEAHSSISSSASSSTFSGSQASSSGGAAKPAVDPFRDSFLRAKDVSKKEMVDEMIRVDHAGEIGAVEIYKGQMWALRQTPEYPLLKVRQRGRQGQWVQVAMLLGLQEQKEMQDVDAG